MEELGKMPKQNIFIEILCFITIVALAGFFLFWKIDKIPPDLDGEMANIAQATYLLGQARINDMSYSKLIQHSGKGAPMERTYGVPTYHLYLQILGRSLPLWTSILYLFLRLFYSTKFAVSLASSTIGIITIVATYFVAKAMYGRRVGFLAALFFSFSLYFLLDARSGWGYHIISGLFALLAIYLLYLISTMRQWRFLWLFGVVWGIGWFNGYSPHLLIPISLVLSIAWTNRDFKFWQKKEFWVPAIIAFSICVGLSIIYSISFNLDSPFQAFHTLNRHWLFRRGGEESIFVQGPIFFFSNLITAIQNLFIGMTYNKASHTSLIVSRKPMIDPFVAIFFLGGLFDSIRKCKIKDILLLLWVGTSFTIFACLTLFQVRYMMVIAPAIYIIAAKAMVDLIKKAREKDTNLMKYLPHRQITVIALIILGIIFSASFTHYNYFKVYAENDGYLWRFVGNQEIAKYIEGKAKPEECQVVFGHPVLVPAENFIFYTQGKYPIMRWNEISKDGSIIQFQNYERGVFTQGKNIIFYVFSLDRPGADTPGKRSWGDYEDLSLFEKLHPELKPAKIIHYTSGFPAFAIYEVKETPKIKYDYHLGLPGQSMWTQTFVLDHPILDKIKFQISYIGEKDSLPNLIVELRKTVGQPSQPDMAETGLLASAEVSSIELNLKEEEYSTLSLSCRGLDPEANYAIVWRQEREDIVNHYILAKQPYDAYENGLSGCYDGSRWIVSNIDINFIPIPADYTFESTKTKGIHTFRISKELTFKQMSFKIIFEDGKWQEEIFDQNGLIYKEDNNGQFRWLTPKEEYGTYLIYKIESPYLIENMKLITNPRIHNDKERKNYIRFSYSVDSEKYNEIYKLNSNGNEIWTGIYEREMYNTIHTNSKVVYLRFDFNHLNTQLWADRNHPIIFHVEIAHD